MLELDILAFGSHPDDVEIGIGGTLIKHASQGYKCGIIDLTRGEAGSNGTPEMRREEALKAAEIMGMSVRDNLGLPDARLKVDEESLRAVIEVIRKYRPRVVLGPYWQDKHPDHLRASQLVREASYLSGLRRYPAAGEPYRPPLLCQYFLAVFAEPTFVVDISACYERKLAALSAHQSQFGLPRDIDWRTLVNNPLFIRMIQARDQYVGSMILALYGEGLYLEQKVVVEDLMVLKGLPQDGPAWKVYREKK
ncbi:MAG: N-acetyl-alpha-D-glucosaminyl L-malate deacetylase 1 [Syntrophomonadaceae bacterium]|nr:N-acetyl-alpha-D-glucosaminyl L-malate deacetylase 1 [Bacillota bacterium]